MERPLLTCDPLSVSPVECGGSFGRTPSASNCPGPPLIESFKGSNGDICSGHAADVEESERKLGEGSFGFLCADWPGQNVK